MPLEVSEFSLYNSLRDPFELEPVSLKLLPIDDIIKPKLLNIKTY